MALEWMREAPNYLRLYDGDNYVAWLVKGHGERMFSYLIGGKNWHTSCPVQHTDLTEWDEAKALVVALYRMGG